MSFLLKNNIGYSTLNPGFIPSKGNLINFNNTIETQLARVMDLFEILLLLKIFIV